MSRSGTWLSVAQYADIVGVTVQAARKRIAKALDDDESVLRARLVAGRGGRAGVRYEVALSSLSEPYQRAFREAHGEDDATAIVATAPAPIGCGYAPAPNQSARIEKRWRVIQEAVETAPRSAARKAEVERASKKWRIATRTIYRWLTDLERAGGDVNALARKKPADAGQRRVYVSRPFDAAFLEAGHSLDDLAAIGEEMDLLVKRGWTSAAQRAGWKEVRRVVLTTFRLDLEARGIVMPPAAMQISQRRVMASQDYREVDIRLNDRKRYDDWKPRIRRDNTKLDPMAQIVMDVKPLDCIVRRPDGTTTWPKMIGFMDTGTHRLFRHIVLLAPGDGIRQEHVADAFIRMVMDPEWGFPQQLYRDNGTEFYVLDMVRSALEMINAPGARTIINAKPYSGASKPIESKFAVLDRFVFSQMGGWAGGNRMNKKTQTVGKPPAPYPGTFEEFVIEANERIDVFEHREIGSGPFKGMTPQGCYAQHVANGWRPIRVDALALDAAFCKRDSRNVDRGAIRIDGVLFRHPELPNRQKLTVALPWRRGAMPLVNIPGFGWAMLQPDEPYFPDQIDGAIASGRMQQRADRHTRQRQREAPPIDLAAVHHANVTALPTRAAPAPIMDALASQQAIEMAEARAEGESIIAKLPTAKERKRAERLRDLEEWEARNGRQKR